MLTMIATYLLVKTIRILASTCCGERRPSCQSMPQSIDFFKNNLTFIWVESTFPLQQTDCY